MTAAALSRPSTAQPRVGERRVRVRTARGRRRAARGGVGRWCVGVGLAVGVLAGGGCVDWAGSQGAEREAERTTVRPRLQLEGLVELSARTEGRVFVDQVLFHAPAVEVRNGPSTLLDVLETDPVEPGPLFFRYDLAAGTYGSALGDERRWNLLDAAQTAPDANLAFSFSPLDAPEPYLEELGAVHGCNLQPLNGYTAVLRGYLTVPAAPAYAAQSAGDGDGAPADEMAAGDGDGAPADEMAAGDGDGAPAAGDGDGAPAAGDGDGAPAAGDGDGAPAAGDGDGAPAAGDGDGAPAAGDGDGSPAMGGDMEGLADNPHRNPLAGTPKRPGGLDNGTRLVPFYLVFDDDMVIDVPLEALGLHTVAPDSYLPIDLHVDADALLSESVLSLIRDSAEQDDAGDGVFLRVEKRAAERALSVTLSQVRVERVRPETGPLAPRAD